MATLPDCDKDCQFKVCVTFRLLLLAVCVFSNLTKSSVDLNYIFNVCACDKCLIVILEITAGSVFISRKDCCNVKWLLLKLSKKKKDSSVALCREI